jgi:succinate dehydrogenase hydrophobic anchor subunit
MASFVQRMIRAAKLDPAIYEEVENDRGATGQAMVVVVLASVAAGIGLYGMNGMRGVASDTIAGEVVGGAIVALISWMVWAFVTMFIGTKLLPEPGTQSNWGELLRTLGFSSSPGILRVLGVIGGLGKVVAVLSSIWMLIAMVVAVRQALDYRSSWRAIGVCLIGFALQWVVVFAALAVIGVSMRSMFSQAG